MHRSSGHCVLHHVGNSGDRLLLWSRFGQLHVAQTGGTPACRGTHHVGHRLHLQSVVWCAHSHRWPSAAHRPGRMAGLHTHHSAVCQAIFGHCAARSALYDGVAHHEQPNALSGQRGLCHVRHTDWRRDECGTRRPADIWFRHGHCRSCMGHRHQPRLQLRHIAVHDTQNGGIRINLRHFTPKLSYVKEIILAARPHSHARAWPPFLPSRSTFRPGCMAMPPLPA